jgi:hypothetical protein
MITGYDHATAMRLYDQGYNDRQIAEALKTIVNVVNIWSKINGLLSQKDTCLQAYAILYDCGFTDTEIARYHDVNLCVVTRWRKKRDLPSQQAKRKRTSQYMDIYAKGANDLEISNACDVIVPAIFQWRKRHSLKVNRKRRIFRKDNVKRDCIMSI